MSHLKESMIISFTASSPTASKYEMIFPIVTPFNFTTNAVGSVGHVEGGAPSGAIQYTITEELASTSVGTINIAATTGAVTFTITATEFSPGDILSIQAPANIQGMTGALGVSLVGER